MPSMGAVLKLHLKLTIYKNSKKLAKLGHAYFMTTPNNSSIKLEAVIINSIENFVKLINKNFNICDFLKCNFNTTPNDGILQLVTKKYN
jgi:hypothetical protein